MLTWTVTDIVHKKWLQLSINNMTCLYKATLHKLIRAYANSELHVMVDRRLFQCRPWFNIIETQGCCQCKNPTLLAEAMKFLLRGIRHEHQGLCTGKVKVVYVHQAEASFTTRGWLRLASTQQSELCYYMPKYSNKIGMHREFFYVAEHGVARTQFVLEIDRHAFSWHFARLPLNSTNRCWAIQTNTWFLCNAKVGFNKHSICTPTYKGMKKEVYSTNNVEYEL